MNLKVIPKEYTDDELCMKLKKWYFYNLLPSESYTHNSH